MTAAVKQESQICLFVKRDLDDYGLDVHEFRLYGRVSRLDWNEDGEAWESVPSMARACCKRLNRTGIALELLRLASLTKMTSPWNSRLHLFAAATC